MTKKWTVFSIALFVTKLVWAQAFTPYPNPPLQALQPYLFAVADSNNNRTIEEMARDGQSFKPLSTFSKIDERLVWWLKLEIKPSFTSADYFIGLSRQEFAGISQGNDNADAWLVHDNKIINHYEVGNLVAQNKRPVARPINHNLFPVTFENGKPLTIYLRISRSINFEPLQFNFYLQHKDVINTSPADNDKLAWFYTGVMLIMFVFGFVFFIITRERAFVWFTCMAATLLLHMQLLMPDNLLTQWLLPNNPKYQFHLFVLFISLSGVFIFQFTRSFVNTRVLLPVWDKVLRGLMIVTFAMMILSLLLLR